MKIPAPNPKKPNKELKRPITNLSKSQIPLFLQIRKANQTVTRKQNPCLPFPLSSPLAHQIVKAPSPLSPPKPPNCQPFLLQNEKTSYRTTREQDTFCFSDSPRSQTHQRIQTAPKTPPFASKQKTQMQNHKETEPFSSRDGSALSLPEIHEEH